MGDLTMKTNKSKLAAYLLRSLLSLAVVSCSDDAVTSPYDYLNNSEMSAELEIMINQIAITDVNESETAELLFMREEEKLARDVYRLLYTKWNQRSFYNISKSENQHMLAILLLINRYELTDPVGSNADGIFTNPDLQSLYNDLIASGSLSLVEALKVGAAIEEIDIIDLDKAIEMTDNEDFKLVYGNLRKGSENHLRAFVSNLSRNGVAYTPQYLTQEEYNEIID